MNQIYKTISKFPKISPPKSSITSSFLQAIKFYFIFKKSHPPFGIIKVTRAVRFIILDGHMDRGMVLRKKERFETRIRLGEDKE